MYFIQSNIKIVIEFVYELQSNKAYLQLCMCECEMSVDRYAEICYFINGLEKNIFERLKMMKTSSLFVIIYILVVSIILKIEKDFN